MSNPEFSIVIPVRNGAQYIAAALESILSQTYQHFNIFILENASQDETLTIVKGFNDPRIQIVPASTPLNIEENWARIISLDLLEYVTMMGHDDLLTPGFLQEIVELIQAEPGASLYQVQFDLVDAQGALIRACLPMPYRQSADQFLQDVHHEWQEVCGTGCVIRSADYKRMGGIPPYPGLLYADVAAWYEAAALSFRVCSPKALVGFRIHDQNAHHLSDIYKHYTACMRFLAFLRMTNYFKKDESNALSYVNELFLRSHRSALVAVILRSDNGVLQKYRQALDQVLTQAEKDRTLRISDSSCKIYASIATFPLRPFRLILLKAFRVVTTLIRKRRERLSQHLDKVTYANS